MDDNQMMMFDEPANERDDITKFDVKKLYLSPFQESSTASTNTNSLSKRSPISQLDGNDIFMDSIEQNKYPRQRNIPNEGGIGLQHLQKKQEDRGFPRITLDFNNQNLIVDE